MCKYQNEYLLNLRDRIENLSTEQKINMRKVIENNMEDKDITYNKNGLFISMGSLTDRTLHQVKELLFLYEDINRFLKKYNTDPLEFY